MKRTAQIFLRFIKYRLTSGHRHGHGIHSPFVFKLVSEVIYGKNRSDRLKKVVHWHRSLYKRKEFLTAGSFGAGSHTGNAKARTIAHIARYSGVSPKYGTLLFRLSGYLKPSAIIELGTGIGISTAYLHSGWPDARMTTVEGEESKSTFAEALHKENRFPDTEFINESFDRFLQDWNAEDHPLMVFIDGDHTYEATMRYCSYLFEKAHHSTVIILDDIHWSEEMERAWEAIRKDVRVTVSIDLFFLGLVFFREGMVKQDFVINF